LNQSILQSPKIQKEEEKRRAKEKEEKRKKNKRERRRRSEGFKDVLEPYAEKQFFTTLHDPLKSSGLVHLYLKFLIPFFFSGFLYLYKYDTQFYKEFQIRFPAHLSAVRQINTR